MKTKVEEIDQLIKETLTAEEAKFYDELEEENAFQMLKGLFQGKNKWFIVLINIVQVIFFILFVYSLTQFFTTEETNELIKWGFGAALFILASSMLKLFTWMQMDKNALIREMKRMELQISSLAHK